MTKIKKILFLTLIGLLVACSVEDTSVEESATVKMEKGDEADLQRVETIVQEDEEVVIVNSNFVGVDQVEHHSGALVTFDRNTGALLGVILPEDCDKDAIIATLEVIGDLLGEDNEQFLGLQETLTSQ